MQTEIIDNLGSIFSILFGLCFAIFHKKMANFAIEMWQKRLKISPPSEMGYQISFLALGIIFLVLGLLRFFDVLK